MVQSTGAVTAGQTFRFTFARSIGAVLNGGVNEQLFPLPNIAYPPGCKFNLIVGNIDVGDQISLVRAVISRYPSDKWAPSTGATPYQE
jgi:hypothetical protein